MDQKLKQRLLGAAVIVSLVVIFVPMLFTEEIEETGEQEWQIPEVPDQYEIKLLPLPTEPLEIETSASEPQATSSKAEASAIERREAPPEEGNRVQSQPREVEVKPAVTASPEPKPETPRTATPAQPTTVKNQQHDKPNLSAWVIQVGSFSRKNNALAFRDKLQTAGFKAFIEPISAQNGTMHRVRVGPELDKKRAVNKLAQLKKQFDLRGIIVPYSGPPGSE